MAVYTNYIHFFMGNKKFSSEEASPNLSSSKLGNQNWFLRTILQKLLFFRRNLAFKLTAEPIAEPKDFLKKGRVGTSHDAAAFISLLITGADVSAIWPAL